ncbi:hypothetical protein D3C87_1403430 [compost metagenome]
MREFALFQLTIECPPLHIKFSRQSIQLGINRLLQERNIHLYGYRRDFFPGNQFVGEMAMLQAVVEVQLTRLETFSYLTI